MEDQLVVMVIIGIWFFPVLLYAAHSIGLIAKRPHEVLQGTFCLAVAASFIAFGVIYVLQSGSLFKPLMGDETLSNVPLFESPISFLITLAFWLFFCGGLLVGGYELIWEKRRKRPKQ